MFASPQHIAPHAGNQQILRAVGRDGIPTSETRARTREVAAQSRRYPDGTASKIGVLGVPQAAASRFHAAASVVLSLDSAWINRGARARIERGVGKQQWNWDWNWNWNWDEWR